jgi:hypothetical protein
MHCLVPLSRLLCKPWLGQPLAAQEKAHSPVYVGNATFLNRLEFTHSDNRQRILPP